MEAYLRNPIVQVWAFLSFITAASWLLSQTRGADHVIDITTTVGVLSIAFIKVRMVIRHFMEVKTAPDWLKKTCDAWLVLTGALILACYGFSLQG